MSLLQLKIGLFDTAAGTAGFAVNWLLQSTLLIAAGVAIAHLLRRRGSAVQSAIYRTTLTATLICPLATWGLSLTGVSGWSLTMPRAWTFVQPPIPSIAATSAMAAPGDSIDSATLTPPEPTIPPAGNTADDNLPANPYGNPSAQQYPVPLTNPSLGSEVPSTAEALATSAVDGPEPLLVQASHVSVHGFGYVAMAIGIVWLVVSVGLLARLAIAWLRLAHLRRTAKPADAAILSTCHEVASQISVRPPDVLHSPFLPSPCLSGINRPAVLLPETATGLSLRDVLIHELAHLRRRDCHWNLLRQIATALFFFQPLVWLLSRRLEATAEEVCDDYVMQLGGDRQEYATRLVDIAELSIAPYAAAGVGIVSFRSMLAQRVARIMDSSRTLSTRVGSLLLLLVLAGGLVGTTAVGLVGLAPQPKQAEAKSASDDAEPSDDVTGERPEVVQTMAAAEQVEVDQDVGDAQPEFDVFGTVVGADGQPVAGAKLDWLTSRVHDLRPMTPRLIATSDDAGRYQFNLPALEISAEDPASWSYHQWIAVRAAGHGVSLERPGDLRRQIEQPNNLVGAIARALTRKKNDATIKLPAAGEPIRGRLVNIDGQPVAGASVRIRWFTDGEADQRELRAAEVRDAEHAEWRVRIGGLLNIIEPASLQLALPAAKTNAAGEFELRDVGPGRLFQLIVAGDRIETAELVVRSELGEPIEVPPDRHQEGESRTVYGRDFLHVVGPSKPIEGRVTDLDTGEPLDDAVVRAYMIHGDQLHSSREREHFSTRTDAEGRYRITGLPVGDGNRLVAFTTGNAPYIAAGHRVDTSADDTTIIQDMQLKQGVWAEGRVFDADLDKPYTGEITYYYFQNEELEKSFPGLRDAYLDGRYWTNANGEFRVPVLPSRGILAFRYSGIDFDRDGIDRYPRGYGADAVEGKDDRMGLDAFPTRPSYLMPSNYNRLAEVNPALGETSVQVDMSLVAPDTVTVQVVDAAGNPLSDYRAFGVRSGWGWEQQKSGKFEVEGLTPDEERKILIFDVSRNLAGGALVSLAGNKTISITVSEAGSIRGRLIDSDGEPITNATLHASLEKFQDDADAAVWPPHPELYANPSNIPVDREGRFHLGGLIPGKLYTAHASAPQKRGNDVMSMGIGSVFEDATVQSGEDKNLGDVVVGAEDREKKVTDRTGAAAPAQKPFQYAGQAVDVAGQPVENADIFLIFYVPQSTGLLTPNAKPIATTNGAGSFHFSVRVEDFGPHASADELGGASLIAVKEGFGFAWSQAGLHESSGEWLAEARSRLKELPAGVAKQAPRAWDRAGEPLRLLADDEPIRGRIMDINGQPVEGARLTLLEVWAGTEDDLIEWREAARQPQADYYSARMKTPRMITNAQVRSVVAPATTDAEGRFTLRGVGRGRIAQLLVEGPGIESDKIFARTEPGEPIELLRERRSPDLGSFIYHPAELTHVAGPSTPITGVVRDAETGKPLAGITVKSQSRHGERIHGWGEDFVRAVTDDAGRYWLEGMPIGNGNRVAAIAPDSEVAYLSVEHSAATEAAGKPLELDFDLPRGVWIEGRITDQASGKGLAGRLQYYAKQSNPHHQRGIGSADERDRLRSNDDGSFRIVVLPGPGYLTFNANDHEKYPRATDIVKPDGGREKVTSSFMQTWPSIMMPQNHHVIAEINPAPDSQRVQLNLELDRGNTLVGRVVGPDGQPVSGIDYSGKRAEFASWDRATGDTFELLGYDTAKPRHVYVIHTDRNLAGHVSVQGEVGDDLIVQLQPAGRVKGRLVDKDGAPLGNCQLSEWHPSIQTDEDLERSLTHHTPPLPRNIAHSRTGRYETDEQGRFEISCLVPGVKYLARAFDRESMTPTRGRMPKFSGPLDIVIQVKPGEDKDLGDVRLTDEAEFTARNQSGEETSASQPAEKKSVPIETRNEIKIQGDVNGPNGQPAAAAHVAVIAIRAQQRRGGELGNRGAILAEATTDRNGRFDLNVADATPQTHQFSFLIARQEGAAVAWQLLDFDSAQTEFEFELAAEEIIRARLVDIDGQPAAGVRVGVRMIMKQGMRAADPNHMVGYEGDQVPDAWLPGAVSDDEGRITLHGIPAGFGAYLEIDGDDRFAQQDLMINTGQPEQRGERDATYRSLVKNMQPGEEAVLPLAPAQMFEGTVTYADTGEPAPHARLTIWASQQAQYGSMMSVAGKADDNGRYRISPRPGVRFGINAYPPDGTPYLVRQTPIDQGIRWKPSDQVRTVDVTLPRGVLVKGRIVEAGNGNPIAGAAIQYRPESANNPNTANDILTGWQAIQLSDDQGRFVLAVLPGPGHLLVHGQVGNYVLQEITDRELSSGKPGGQRYYAHAFEKLDLEAGAESLDVKIELEPGAIVTGEIVDADGLPVDNVTLLHQLNISPTSPHWRGHTQPTLGGQFEIGGLAASKEYLVHLLDAQRKLGATVTIRADEPNPRVVLQPCGSAVMRIVDDQGEPLPNLKTVDFFFIMRPGEYEFNLQAYRAGKIAADADFISNVDRLNYPDVADMRPDNEGRVHLPVLIPGATYRVIGARDGTSKAIKDFVATAGETINLGDLVVDAAEN